MSEVKPPKWAIIGIAALVLLGIGSAVYNSGWSQGFLVGLLTGQTDGAAITPYLVSRTQGWHGGMGGFFGFFGAIFRFFFFIFLIGLMLKFFGFMRWRRHGWHRGAGWGGPGWGGPGGHGERVEGHYGPWWQQPAQQPQGQPQPQQPGQPASPPQSETAGGEPGPENKPQPVSWTRV